MSDPGMQYLAVTLQIKTLEESERLYLEQIEFVKQLKAENAELQTDARTISSLRAEVAELTSKVNSSSIAAI